MEELNLEIMNELIEEVAELNNTSFNNFRDALIEYNERLDQNDLTEFLSDNFNISSEADLADLSDEERETLVTYIKNVY